MSPDTLHASATPWVSPTASGSVAGRSRTRKLWFWVLTFALIVFVIFLHWSASLLIAGDSLTNPVDEAIVLQGSILGEQARIQGAIDLLQRRLAGRMLISIPKENYWGQAISPIALAYIEKRYGPDIASRTDFCETGPEVKSTEQEAKVLATCIRQHRLNSVAVVTSNYHTRRAGMIWRKLWRQEHFGTSLVIFGVDDPEFQSRNWWRDRRSAKT